MQGKIYGVMGNVCIEAIFSRLSGLFNMNILLGCFSILCAFVGLFMVIVAANGIINECRQIHSILAPHETMLPWYTNATLRKQSEWFISGVLLIMAMVGILFLLNRAVFGLLWISLSAFLYSCSNSLFTVVREMGQRRLAQERGEKPHPWLYSTQFHQGIAMSIFFLGASAAALLNGLVSMKTLSFSEFDQMAWLWECPMLVGAVYWLTALVLSVVKVRRH